MSAAAKSRDEHRVIYEGLVAKGSPLAATYYAIHCVPTREQATQRAATVDYPRGDCASGLRGTKKTAAAMTAWETQRELVRTNDPRATIHAATHWHEIHETRPKPENE